MSHLTRIYTERKLTFANDPPHSVKRVSLNKLVWFPLNPAYADYHEKNGFKKFMRRKHVFSSVGFYDATFEIVFADPIRFGFYCILKD